MTYTSYTVHYSYTHTHIFTDLTSYLLTAIKLKRFNFGCSLVFLVIIRCKTRIFNVPQWKVFGLVKASSESPTSVFTCLPTPTACSRVSRRLQRVHVSPDAHSVFTCLPTPNSVFTCLPTPTACSRVSRRPQRVHVSPDAHSVFTCLPTPSSVFTCLPTPTACSRVSRHPQRVHMSPDAQQRVHVSPDAHSVFTCLPTPSSVFTCLPTPTLSSYNIYLITLDTL